MFFVIGKVNSVPSSSVSPAGTAVWTDPPRSLHKNGRRKLRLEGRRGMRALNKKQTVEESERDNAGAGGPDPRRLVCAKDWRGGLFGYAPDAFVDSFHY
jgi:hypothetical protein